MSAPPVSTTGYSRQASDTGTDSLLSCFSAAEANLETSREAAQQIVVDWRQKHMERIKARFFEDNDALALITAHSDVMDEIIRTCARLLMPGTLGVAVAATGGYGRAELFPYSDIDLLILYRPAARASAERIARTLLYILWDLGLKVGHALRGIDDTLQLAREDITIRTNVLDARLVAGDRELFTGFMELFQSEIVEQTSEDFIERKLAERSQRHQRFGESRYLLEPNLKEGKGGLRDLHTIHWLARYVYGVSNVGELVERGLLSAEEYEGYVRAIAFYRLLRAHLHYLSGKGEERLTFDKQQALAPLMGFRGHGPNRAVERMMRRYFVTASAVGSLTRILCATLEDQHKRKPRLPLAARLHNLWRLEGFALDGERVNVKREDEFARDPLRMFRLFAVAQEEGLDIHPHALRLVSRSLPLIDRKFQHSSQAANAFMQILLSNRGPEQTLRRMNEVGLLGRYLPDFARVVGRMQFNMYHIYTVDEHIIVALGVLWMLEQGRLKEDMPQASDVIRRIRSRRVLYLALLCHDIAKGRHGDHSVIGGEIALKLARRFGFPEEEAQMCAWLVRNHLVFTEAAFKRDISDPETIKDFSASVQSVERLRLLFLLTVADVRAVGPGVWNAWKATLLRNLYIRTEEYIRSGRLVTGEQEKAALRHELAERLPLLNEEGIDAYLALGNAEFLESLSVESHAQVALLVQRVQHEGARLALDFRQDRARGVTEVAVIALDSHALFSKLTGAIALVGANIVGAKIFTLKNGFAVDLFQLQDGEGKAFDRAGALSRLAVKMEQALGGQLDLEKELAKQKPSYARSREAFEVTGQVYIENEASSTHTVIEVVGRDRVGFLHNVTRALSEAGLNISSAHISTYGVQAVDVFYVKDAFGLKIVHEKKLHEVREALLKAVNPPAAWA